MITTKGAVIVLVDGISDKVTFVRGFEDYYKEHNTNVRIYPIRYDVSNVCSIKNGVFDASIIKKELTNIVKKCLNINKLNKSDIKEVIEVVDIDGVYLNPCLIKEDKGISEITYYKDKILVIDKELILKRNENKKRNLDILSKLSSIYNGIPYSAYYCSCNLEHVFNNKMNCSDEEKEKFSNKHLIDYTEDISLFYNDINKNEVKTRAMTYLESWDELMKIEDHVPRLTNLSVFFKENKK